MPGYVNPQINLSARWSGVIREFICNRDKTCQVCGSTKRLDVHHMDGNGKHLTENPNQNPNNLILLCHKCHMRLHFQASGRNKDIVARRKGGETLQSIGTHYALSRQRILQITQNFTKTP